MSDNTKVAELPAKWQKVARDLYPSESSSVMAMLAEELERALAWQEAGKTAAPVGQVALFEMFSKLKTGGGCIVSSGDCGTMEIVDAQARGDFTADADGFGFVLRPHAWLQKHSRFASGANDSCEQQDAAPPAAQADDDWHLRGYAYASKQATTCAGCGEHKHTPLRIDAMGGYVCLTCIDNKLSSLLCEFGYTAAQAVDLDGLRELADAVVITNATGNERLFLGAVEKLLARVRTLIDQQAGKGGDL